MLLENTNFNSDSGGTAVKKNAVSVNKCIEVLQNSVGECTLFKQINKSDEIERVASCFNIFCLCCHLC